jgi:DNA repair exonuclease SbcCD ATPase subunit
MSRFLSCLSACSVHTASEGNAHDLGFEVLLEKHEKVKKIFLQASWEENVINLCSDKGVVLKSIALSSAEFSSCTLHGHIQCVCIRYVEPGKSEIMLKSSSQDAVNRVLSELSQSQALCHSVGVCHEPEEAEVCQLKRHIKDINSSLEYAQEEALHFKMETQTLQKKIDEITSERACTPSELKKYLKRIDELERVNAQLDEDLRIEMRQSKKIYHQMEMMKRELERSEEEKSALMESLSSAHTQISDMESSQQDKRIQMMQSDLTFRY